MTYFNSISVARLTNNRHLGFHTQVKTTVEQFGTEKLKINEALFDDYCAAISKEEALSAKIATSKYTMLIKQADGIQDNLVKGLTGIIDSYLRFPDEDKKMSAHRLKFARRAYKDLTGLPLVDGVTAVRNFVYDMKNDFAQDINALHLKEWIEKLDACNKNISDLMNTRYNEASDKVAIPMVNVRKDADGFLNKIIMQTEAHITIDGIDEFAEFVNLMNVIIKKFGSTGKKMPHIETSTDNEGDNGGDEKYPNAREWSSDIDYQTCASGDIFYIVRNGVKEYYKLLDYGEVTTFEPGMDDGGIWEKLN